VPNSIWAVNSLLVAAGTFFTDVVRDHPERLDPQLAGNAGVGG
jgi:hypothetical protein